MTNRPAQGHLPQHACVVVCETPHPGCRDISPSNLVVYEDAKTAGGWAPLLLDLHVATSMSRGGAAEDQSVTGKTLYMSLRLREGKHSVATDLESLFYR